MVGGGALRRVGKYEVGRTIGEGTFAKVKFAQNTESGESVAMKVVDRSSILKHKMADQVLASRKKIFIILEFITGGELFDKIIRHGRLNEADARRYFQQLIDGVDFCHSKGVYHRDLKPENLLLDSQGNLKISDFGLSAWPAQGGALLRTTCGTPNYVAPEVVVGVHHPVHHLVRRLAVLVHAILCKDFTYLTVNLTNELIQSSDSNICMDLTRMDQARSKQSGARRRGGCPCRGPHGRGNAAAVAPHVGVPDRRHFAAAIRLESLDGLRHQVARDGEDLTDPWAAAGAVRRGPAPQERRRRARDAELSALASATREAVTARAAVFREPSLAPSDASSIAGRRRAPSRGAARVVADPAVLSHKGYDGALADTWSCGVILYVLLAGYLPFDEVDLTTLYGKIESAEYSFPAWFPNGAKSLIHRILDPNPDKRIRIEEIRNDEWFKKNYEPTREIESEEVNLDDVNAAFDDPEEDADHTLDDEAGPLTLNAFDLIILSQGLNLAALFDRRQDYDKLQNRFLSRKPAKVIMSSMEVVAQSMGYKTHIRNYKTYRHEDL
ncbi:hypothetical protein OsI_02303 [Oryza sativa Indica Group]|uniref:non-specific serine/threonine protein kinase n=1 Tax=Oryza sativa subsp. indica TaxID=39946 RepID=B8A9P2_ORYSI|nr:hypothetical protein OsI_02303 [Oryza sativa Indica Group]